MAHTYALGKARTSSGSNPTTTSYTVNSGDTVICLMIKAVASGGAFRSGGAPDLGAAGTFTQANSTQNAATSPEAAAELWYLLNPPAGTYTLTIPNTRPNTLYYTVAVGRSGQTHSKFNAANGGNNTSTNPSPGSITCAAGDIVFAIVATGAQTWAPTAQAGTIITNTDDGVDGGGEQYSIRGSAGAFTLNWTFGTSDDWGAVAAAFSESSPQTVTPGTASLTTTRFAPTIINPQRVTPGVASLSLSAFTPNVLVESLSLPGNRFNNYMGVKCASAGIISVTERAR